MDVDDSHADRESAPDLASGAGLELVWLAHRAAEALTGAFNSASRGAGLADLRDWLVLALISDGADRTQIEIASELDIDKTTLVTVLDRLEQSGLIVRGVSDRDRRARIPRITPKGLEVKSTVAIAKEAAIDNKLTAIPVADRPWFHATLWRIVQGDGTDDQD